MYSRSINPSYEFIKSKRYNHRRLTGYRARLFDGETVIYDRDHSTYSEAETALDQYVHDLLTDGMHRTATELDGGQAE